MDEAQTSEDRVRMLPGETVEMPTYNFKRGLRE